MKVTVFILAWLLIGAATFEIGCIASSLAESPALPQHCRHDEVVTLSGHVYLEQHFGPPNYGEEPTTDAVETAYILVLDQPLSYFAESREIETDVREVQLVVDWHHTTTPRLLQTHVFQGRLWDWETGHHVRPVLLSMLPEELQRR